MRRTTICFVMVLWSAIAFGQDEPQWKVVKHLILTQQAQVNSGSIFTPTEPGIYRLNLYFSVTGGAKGLQSYYEATLQATDITGAQVNGGSLLFCDEAGAYWMPPIMLSLRPETPLTYYVFAQPATASCKYNLAITVEQLM